MEEWVDTEAKKTTAEDKRINEVPLDNLYSNKETLLREWDFEQEERSDDNELVTTNKKIVLTDERLIVAQEYKKKSVYKRKKYSYKLDDIRAINTYEERGKVAKKNPLAIAMFVLAGLLFFGGMISVIVNSSSNLDTVGNSTNGDGSIVGLIICFIVAIILCIVGALMREKKEKTAFVVLEIETTSTVKHQLLKASKFSEGTNDYEIKTAIILPANNDTKLFVDELDNAIIEAQMRKAQSKTSSIPSSTKTTKRTKK